MRRAARKGEWMGVQVMREPNPGRLPGKANRAPAAIEAGEYLIGGMGIEHG